MGTGEAPAGPASAEPPLVVDQTGQLCPLPVIALASALRGCAAVELLSDDPAAQFDIPAWCRLTGAVLLGTSTDAAGVTHYLVHRVSDT